MSDQRADNAEVEHLDMKALAWRGVAEQLAARLYVLGESSPALASFERMKEADSWAEYLAARRAEQAFNERADRAREGVDNS